MNLFYLDNDLDKCAEYHIDKHVGKLQLEAVQIMCTTLWVDKHLGFIPRKLTSEELKVINDAKSAEPEIESRTFTRYLPTHINHPCTVWARSSLEHHYWVTCYVNALNSENVYRGYKSHMACEVANTLPDPVNLPDKGWYKPALAMPEQYKFEDPVEAYRAYYINEKANIASWKVRGQPYWWSDK